MPPAVPRAAARTPVPSPAAQIWPPHSSPSGLPPSAPRGAYEGGRPAGPLPAPTGPPANQPPPASPGPPAHPWEVPAADAAPYDWYADEPPTGHAPGTPRWDPPPGFTAAAAGMQVWPAPVSDTPAMPPWPAATGEPVPGLDGDETSPGGPRPDSATPSAPPTNTPAPPSDPQPSTGADPTAQGVAPQTATPHPIEAAAHPTPQPATGHPAGPPSAPDDRPETRSPSPAQPTGAPGAPPVGARPAEPGDVPVWPAPHPPAQPAPENPTGPEPAPASPQPAAAQPPGPQPTAAHPTGPQPTTGQPTHSQPAAGQSAGRPVPGPDASPAPQPGDTTTPADGPGTEPPATSATHAATDPGTRQPAEPPAKPPATRPGAPATAMPPPPQTEEQRQEEQLPELPFTRDIWGKPPTPSPTGRPLQHPPTTFPLPKPPPGAPGQPDGPFKQLPAPAGPSPEQPGKSKRALLATVGVLVLAGVATGGFFAYRSLSAPPPRATTAATATTPPPTSPAATEQSPSATPDVPAAAVLDSDRTDPKKMSLSEAFPRKKVEAAGADFTRIKTHNEATCEEAASGPFAEALRDGRCSRVLRATYVDAKRRYAVTSGIAVFPTKEAALRADRTKNLSRNVWFRPLPGPAGSGGERVHIAGGYAAGVVWGRYIVFSYATYADGHTPGAKDKTLGKVSDAFRDEMSLVLERRIADG